jgi:hypothetical protein
MEEDTLELIQKVANERQLLYRLAGKQHLTLEQQSRLDEITNKLPVLWDEYRRELAASRQPKKNLAFQQWKAA